MTKTIKIGLIALVVIAIAGVLWWTLKTPTDGISELHFDNSSYFVSQVESQCKTEIKNATSFDNAQTSFNSMLQDIQDAAYLENIDSDEASDSKMLLARYFAPVLAAHAETIFGGHEWSESHIDALKDETQVVLATNSIEANSDVATKLNAIIKNVNDYHAAKAATQVGRCSTVQAVRAAIDKANRFNREPLNNCTSLKNAIKAVPQKAKNSLAQVIIAECNKAAAGHGSIDAAKARIKEYKAAFHDERPFANAKSKLHDAERRHSANHDNASTTSSSRSRRHQSQQPHQQQIQQPRQTQQQQTQPSNQERRRNREFEFD